MPECLSPAAAAPAWERRRHGLARFVFVGLCGALSGGLAASALAQAVTSPVAAPSWPQAVPLPSSNASSTPAAESGASAPVPVDASGFQPLAVVTVFDHACLQTEAQMAPAIDWALQQGFMPLDAAAAAFQPAWLGGEPGSVLVAPETDGRVKLAVSAQQCTVWAEQVAGPPLRAAVSAWVDSLSVQRDARLKAVIDRNVERAGAWRNQLGWRYRAASAAPEWNLGLATTLGDQAGTQVLRMAAAASASAPSSAASAP